MTATFCFETSAITKRMKNNTMESVEVTGIVLSSMPVGEADRRLLLLTRELGKISAFARGARKPTSTLVSSTRPFAFGKFHIFPGRNSYSVHRTEIQEYFEPLVMDISKSAYGCYFLELSGMFARENTDESETLLLLYYSLKALLNERIPDTLVQRIFELKLLQLNGLLPEFSVCGRCRREITEGIFKPGLMQVVCADCAGEDTSGFPLSKSALFALNHLRAAAPNKLYTFMLTDEVFREVADLTEFLLNRSLDRPPVSREMLTIFTE